MEIITSRLITFDFVDFGNGTFFALSSSNLYGSLRHDVKQSAPTKRFCEKQEEIATVVVAAANRLRRRADTSRDSDRYDNAHVLDETRPAIKI